MITEQSRFIAAVENYNRTLELQEVAQNAAGTGAEQLSRSMDSIETALNKIKSTWQDFYTDFLSSDLIKTVLGAVNSLIEGLKSLNDVNPILTIFAVTFTIAMTKIAIETGKKFVTGLAQGIISTKETVGTTLRTVMTEAVISAKEAAQAKMGKSPIVARVKVQADEKDLLRETKDGRRVAQVRTTSLKKNERINSANRTFSVLSGRKQKSASGIDSLALKQQKTAQKYSKLANKSDESLIKTLKNKNNQIAKNLKIEKESLSVENASIIRTKLQTEAENLNNMAKMNGASASKQQAAADLYANIAAGEKVSMDQLQTLYLNAETEKERELIIEKMKEQGMSLKQALALATEVRERKIAQGEIVKSTLATKAETTAQWALNAAKAAGSTLLGNFASMALASAAAMGMAALSSSLFGDSTTEATESIEDFNESSNELKKSIQDTRSMVQKYEEAVELQRKGLGRTTTEDERYKELLNDLADTYPDLIDNLGEETQKVKDEGSARAINNDSIDKEIQKKRELFKINEKAYSQSAAQAAKAGAFVEGSAAAKANETTKTWASAMANNLVEGSELFTEAFGDVNVDDKLVTRFKEGLKTAATEGMFSFNALNQILDNDLSEKAYEDILAKVESGELKTKDEFLKAIEDSSNATIQETRGLETIFANLNTTYENFQKGVENYMEDLADVKAVNVAKEAAAELGETLPDELLQAIKKADGKIKEKFSDIDVAADIIESYYTNLTDQQRSGIENFVKNLGSSPAALDENYQKQILERMGFNNLSETMQQVILEAFTVKREELQKTISDAIDPNRGFITQSIIDSLKLTPDQVKAMSTSYKNVVEEFKSRGFNEDSAREMANRWRDALLDSLKDASEEAREVLLGVDITDMSSISKAAVEWTKLGKSPKEFFSIMNLSGPMYLKTMTDMTEVTDTLKESLDDVTDAYSNLADAAKGELDFEGVLDLIQASGNVLKASDFTYSASGFKLSEENRLKAQKAIVKEKKTEAKVNQILLQQSLASMENATNFNFKRYNELLQQFKKGLITESNQEFQNLLGQYNKLTDEEKQVVLQAQKAQQALELWDLMDAAIDSAEMASNLDDAVERMETLVEKTKEWLDYILDFDGFKNIENIIEDLETKEATIDLRLEMTVDEEGIENAYKDKFDSISKRISANLAKSEKSALAATQQRNFLSKQFGKYVSFDKDGNLIRNDKEFLKLQKQIASSGSKGGESDSVAKQLDLEKEKLEAFSDALEKGTDKYNEYHKAATEAYNSAIEGIKEQKELYDELRDNVIDQQDKLYDLLVARDEKRVTMLENTYSALKQADSDYLDQVKKNIDKEKQLRERSDTLDDLADKEQKLATLRMDTSGKNASQILSLEKELAKQRQTIADTAVNDMYNDLKEEADLRAAANDREVTYQKAVLDFKKQDRTEYNKEVAELMKQDTDTILATLKNLDDSWHAATKEGREKWEEENTLSINKAKASWETMSSVSMKKALSAYQEIQGSKGAKGYGQAVDEYTEKVTTTTAKNNKSIKSMKNQYSSLITVINGDGKDSLTSAMSAYISKIKEAQQALSDLNAQRTIGDDDNSKKKKKTKNGEGPNKEQQSSGTEGDVPTGTLRTTGLEKTYSSVNYTGYGEGGLFNQFISSSSQFRGGSDIYIKPTGIEGQAESVGYSIYKQLKNGTLKESYAIVGLPETAVKKGKKVQNGTKFVQLEATSGSFKDFNGISYSKIWMKASGAEKYYGIKYKTGGLVDYTGPAWVDGTPNKPEAFLSAKDTQMIRSFTDVLSCYASPSSTTFTSTAPSEKGGDTYYENHFHIDEIADDYDVDRMIERVEEDILQKVEKTSVTVGRNK